MTSKFDFNTDWRKVAATIYRKPKDSKILGAADIDVTDLEEYIAKKRKEGVKITLTHVFVIILARALRDETPDLNTYVRRGNIVSRDSIDAGVSVLKANGEMSSVIVPGADKLSMSQLADFLKNEIVKSRKGNENNTMQSKNMLASLPWPFRSWLYFLYKSITINWGISIPGVGLSANSFGSFLITNIGSIGLDTGYPALLPSSNVSFVMVLGGVKKKPVVVDDKIVIRKILALSAVVDHRIADASQAGKIYRYIKYMVKHPHLLEE